MTTIFATTLLIFLLRYDIFLLRPVAWTDNYRRTCTLLASALNLHSTFRHRRLAREVPSKEIIIDGRDFFFKGRQGRRLDQGGEAGVKQKSCFNVCPSIYGLPYPSFDHDWDGRVYI
ncbi:hypothetical protein GGS21DRAFT_161081 [Xylaria nigripes]|nr:hypothetical protein GGS21DRAFT_161081 [Xylaria nigripes]